MEKPNIFSFDICFLNDIAVANSGLLREYSLVDPRVRKLMMAVKLWAKEHQINSARNGSISSYAWINLVIFYLQCIRFVPNLQCTKLMKKVSFVANPQANAFHSEKKLDTCYVTWEQVKSKDAWSQDLELSEVSVSALLYGFFEFYSRRFPGGSFSVSIKKGGVSLSKVASNKARLFLSIEDPFETYDSHCPHDLGSPAAESGTRDMLECFHTSESQLRQILLGTRVTGKLWPEVAILSETPASKARNTRKFNHMVDHTNRKEHSERERDNGKTQGGGPGRAIGQSRNRFGRVRHANGREGPGGRGPKSNTPRDQCQAVSGKTMGETAVAQVQQQQATTTTTGPKPKNNAAAKKITGPTPKNTEGKDKNGINVADPSGSGDGENSPKGPGPRKLAHSRRRTKRPAKQGGADGKG